MSFPISLCLRRPCDIPSLIPSSHRDRQLPQVLTLFAHKPSTRQAFSFAKIVVHLQHNPNLSHCSLPDQTGSGKTHSLLNPGEGALEQAGLVTRLAGQLFMRIAADRRNSYGVQLAFCQIYNETVSYGRFFFK